MEAKEYQVEAGAVLQDMLVEFHEKFGHAISNVAVVPASAIIDLRIKLIEEEVKETLTALSTLRDRPWLDADAKKVQLIEALDGIADSCYVLIGTAVTMGLPFGSAFAEVHASNMSKTPAPLEAQDPSLKYAGNHQPKGQDYKPPNLEQFL
jgi:predicted HAD superfamily Cof-like phosphohydrolase